MNLLERRLKKKKKAFVGPPLPTIVSLQYINVHVYDFFRTGEYSL